LGKGCFKWPRSLESILFSADSKMECRAVASPRGLD
jgi:hypothetical protein